MDIGVEVASKLKLANHGMTNFLGKKMLRVLTPFISKERDKSQITGRGQAS